jgi:hypothetical protein
MFFAFEIGFNFNFQIFDPSNPRYEVPVAINKPYEVYNDTKSLGTFIVDDGGDNSLFGFKIIRKENNNVL